MSCNSAVPVHVISWNKNADKVTIGYKYSWFPYVSIKLTVNGFLDCEFRLLEVLLYSPVQESAMYNLRTTLYLVNLFKLKHGSFSKILSQVLPV